jgi:hypothetical protein
MQCCTQYNYDCPQCPRVIPVAQHCEPVTSGKPCIQALREKLFRQCEKDCATEPDPCAPTGSTTRCVDGSAPVDPLANPGGPEGISCPEGKTCQYAGYLEINGKTCYFYNTWVTDDIPPECEECDCNCHDDCPDCELCGANGECYPDPECEDKTPVFQLDGGLCLGSFAQIEVIGTGCDFNGLAGWACSAVYALRAAGSSTWEVRSCGGASGLSGPECQSGFPIVSAGIAPVADATVIDPVPVYEPDVNDPVC